MAAPNTAGSSGSHASAGSTGSHASAGSTGSRTSEDATGPLLVLGTVPLVGIVCQLEPRIRCRVLSRQSHHYAHLPPSLPAPAPRDTHLDSITFLITSPKSVTPLCSFLNIIVSVPVFYVCALLVFLILFNVPLFMKFTPCTCFPILSIHVTLT